MKTCPFCRNSIEEDSDYCSFCGRTLVERFESPVQSQGHEEKIRDNFSQSTSPSSNKVFRSLSHVRDNFRRYFFACGGALIALVLLVSFISTDDEPVPVIPVVPIENVAITTSIPVKDPSTYVSLLNGKIFTKNANFLRGNGELTISNGTSSDAIAKLVSRTNNKSIFTVYIKANNKYVIKNISDGSYKLFFNLGNDWDDTKRAFAVNSSYEVFEDLFDFETTATQYTTFSVTLDPVAGGSATTNDTNPQEFGNY